MFVPLATMKTAIIGGGAAGFFLAISLKELMPEMEVTIFERSQKVLAKVEVSGGGRCNCTNSFREVRDLSSVYPRGHRLMKRLFNVFNQQDAYQWFERHGVPLMVQDDECVFPKAQDSHAIIDCFLSLARRYQIQICTGRMIQSLADIGGIRRQEKGERSQESGERRQESGDWSQEQGYDFVVVTTGGSPKGEGLRWLADLGHEIEAPVPSLFTLRIPDSRLTALQGVVVDACVHIPSTKFRAEGTLLLTHWGMSGPAILKLSSYAARYLAEQAYQVPLSIRWTKLTESEVQSMIYETAIRQPQKLVTTFCPFGLPQRLWAYVLEKSLERRVSVRWVELNKKDVNRLVNVLVNDNYQVAGRAAFKDEFVTCGGISLKSVNPSTLESRHIPHLYFAGEVLDIDGITGGFNFQAAWTTATVVARAIVAQRQ